MKKQIVISTFIFCLILGFAGARADLVMAPKGAQSIDLSGCPSWLNSNDVPLCPEGDNTTLPTTYPAMAYVVSDDPIKKTSSSQEFTAKFVLDTLIASGDRIPQILMPVSEETFNYVKSKIEAYTNVNPLACYNTRGKGIEICKNRHKKKQWLDALVRIQGTSFTWQQDHMEPFFNPQTGRPVLREIRDYSQARGMNMSLNSEGSQNTNGTCGLIQYGEKLPPESEQNYQIRNGHYGGNIEALPGGLCLRGNTQDWEGFAEHYCGSKSNDVVVDVSWLTVGHVDEVVGVIPNKKAKPPCDFAVAVSSPKKAIELMKKNSNEKFISFFSNDPNADLSRTATERSRTSSMDAICNLAENFERAKQRRVRPREQSPDRKGRERGAQKLGFNFDSIINLFLGEAYAGASLKTRSIESREEDNTLDIDEYYTDGCPGTQRADLTGITNGQLAGAIEDDENASALNYLVQKKMDKAKVDMRTKLKERLPKCNIEFIDVPDLFLRGQAVKIEGAPNNAPIEERFELPKGVMVSLLPNATNLVVVEDTLVAPDPQSATFRDYLSDTYQNKLGLKYQNIDTYDYCHRGQGNLHCSTNAIRTCRPRAKR